jgi:type IV secretory pathway VirB10-like protein
MSDTKKSSTVEVAAGTSEGKGSVSPPAGGEAPQRPAPGRRSLGAKEIVPFAWKVVGNSRGTVVTLFKSIDREEAEGQLERLVRDGYYRDLRLEVIEEPPPPAPPPPAPEPPPPPPPPPTRKSRKPASEAPASAKPASTGSTARTAARGTRRSRRAPADTKKTAKEKPARRSRKASTTRTTKKTRTARASTKKSGKKRSA